MRIRERERERLIIMCVCGGGFFLHKTNPKSTIVYSYYKSHTFNHNLIPGNRLISRKGGFSETVSTTHNSYMTVIVVHELHGQMHHNHCQITILRAHYSLSSAAYTYMYLMVTHMYMYVHVPVYMYMYTCGSP